MTDQMIPAGLHPDDVALARDFADEYRDSEYAPDRTLAVARVLQALLPAPPLPTLAGMTEEQRAGCQWMQADTSRWGHSVIIRPDVGGGRAAMLDEWGHVDYEDHADVTPRPDLPRLEWPGTEEGEPRND